MKKNLKILYVAQHFDPYTNGEIKFIYNCALHFLREGHEVHIAGYNADPNIIESGAKFYKIPILFKKPALVKFFFFILYTLFFLSIRRKKFDLIHVSGPNVLFFHHINTCQFVHSAYKKYISKIPFPFLKKVYYYIHYNIASIIEKLAYKKTKIIIAVSKKVKRELIKFAKVKPTKIKVIYNGINPREFPFKSGKEKEKLLNEYPFLKDKITFLFAGDIKSNRKGIENLIKAFKDIDEEIFLIILGNEKGSPYPKMVREMELETKIIFLGFKKNISFYYRASDFFIFPTLYDPCPMVIFEALSSGTPSIVSKEKYCGSAEIIEDGKDGFLIKNPFDIEEIKNAIKKAIKYKDRLKELSINSRKKAEKVFFKKIFEEYEKIYLTFI